MRILIVDDSRAMRLIVARTLRHAGYRRHDIIEASGAAEAFDLVVKRSPDLVLADWNMPQMTGLELLHKLRGAGLETPFGFITSWSAPDMRAIAAQAGAAFLIAKPFNVETLSGALATVAT